MPEYIYEYQHDGSMWSVTVWADDREEAGEKLQKISCAKYVGEVMAKVPASLGFLAKAWCVVANFFRSK